MNFAPINHISAWKGNNIQDSSQWIYNFTSTDIKEIESAMLATKKSCLSLKELNKQNFLLPSFAHKIKKMLNEIEDGLGLYLFRGFPVSKYDKDDLRRIFWGIGLHCGKAVSQSKKGDVLGDVKDLETPLDGPEFRGYTSSGKLSYHSDAADVTALFCLHPAKKGGLSRIVSLVAIHNQIVEERPDLLVTLYHPYHWGRQGNELPNQSPYYTQPIFSNHLGKFAGRYTRTHIRTAELGGITPPLTQIQSEALLKIDEICDRPEFQLTMMFEAGDIQFLNNHITLHTRTAYEDYKDESRRRHLLRLWFSPPNSRPLSDGFKPFFCDVGAGAVRGGFPSHENNIVFQT